MTYLTNSYSEPTKQSTSQQHRQIVTLTGYAIYPSSLSLAKQYLFKAQDKGLVRSSQDFGTGLSALLSAGMVKASEYNVKYVKPRHIKEGWTEILSVGGGNCPPHNCVARSVLNRVEDLKVSLPRFSDVLKIIRKDM